MQVEKKRGLRHVLKSRVRNREFARWVTIRIGKLGKEMSVTIKFETGVLSIFPRVPLHWLYTYVGWFLCQMQHIIFLWVLKVLLAIAKCVVSVLCTSFFPVSPSTSCTVILLVIGSLLSSTLPVVIQCWEHRNCYFQTF